MDRLALAALATVGLALAGCGTPDQPLASREAQVRQGLDAASVRARPNFLIIVTDDQRLDDLDPAFMPRTYDLIARQGVRFTHAFVTTSLCCPSRASILTGMYARRHLVRTNSGVLAMPIAAGRLREAGYHTGHVGKFLNSSDGSPRPEFDFWVSSRDNVIDYFDPDLNVNGVWGIRAGYNTYVLRDYALEFLRKAPRNRPFLLYFMPIAPHGSTDPAAPPFPAPGDELLYSNLAPYTRPNFDEADVSDKPTWLQALPRLTASSINGINNRRRKRLQSLKAVDRAIDAILSLLRQQGRLDNTFVLFMSDNGFFYGEHRLHSLACCKATLAGKDRVYEEGHRIPFVVRYPPLVPSARVSGQLVANIDVAPTMYELAGLPIPPEVNGRSLVPLLRGTTSWRDAVLLESSLEITPTYNAIRTTRYVYVETPGHRSELYDLQLDPYELENVVDKPEYAQVVAELRVRLALGRD